MKNKNVLLIGGIVMMILLVGVGITASTPVVKPDTSLFNSVDIESGSINNNMFEWTQNNKKYSFPASVLVKLNILNKDKKPISKEESLWYFSEKENAFITKKEVPPENSLKLKKETENKYQFIEIDKVTNTIITQSSNSAKIMIGIKPDGTSTIVDSDDNSIQLNEKVSKILQQKLLTIETISKNQIIYKDGDKKYTYTKGETKTDGTYDLILRDSNNKVIKEYSSNGHEKTLRPDGTYSYNYKGKDPNGNKIELTYLSDKDGKTFTDLRVNGVQVNDAIYKKKSDDINHGKITINKEGHLTIGENVFIQNSKDIDEYVFFNKDPQTLDGSLIYRNSQGDIQPQIEGIRTEILKEVDLSDRPSSGTFILDDDELQVLSTILVKDKEGPKEETIFHKIYKVEDSTKGESVVKHLTDFADKNNKNSFISESYKENDWTVNKVHKYDKGTDGKPQYDSEKRLTSQFTKTFFKDGVYKLQTHKTSQINKDGKEIPVKNPDTLEGNYRTQDINYNTIGFVSSGVTLKMAGGKPVLDKKGNPQCDNGGSDCNKVYSEYKEQSRYESMGEAWSNAVQTAGLARGVAKFLGFKVTPFTALQDFLNTNPMGQILSGNLEDALMCNKFVKRAASEGILITPYEEYGRILAPIAAHAEGERSVIFSQCTHDDNCTILFGDNSKCDLTISACMYKDSNLPIQESLYKITYSLDAQVQDMTVDIELRGPQKTVRLLSGFSLEMGDSKSMSGSNAIIQRSRNVFTQICVNIDAVRGGEFCNLITAIPEAPALIVEEQRQIESGQVYTGISDSHNYDWD